MKQKLWTIAWLAGLFCLFSAPLSAQDDAAAEPKTEETSTDEASPKKDKKRQAALAGWVKNELVVAKKAAAMVKKVAKKPSEAEKTAEKLEKMAEPFMDLYGPGAKANATVTKNNLTKDEIVEAQKPFAKQRAIVLKSLEKYLDDFEDSSKGGYGYSDEPEEFVPAVKVFINMMTD